MNVSTSWANVLNVTKEMHIVAVQHWKQEHVFVQY